MQATDTSLSDNDALKALEAFVVDNEDLERLETLIAEFNIFEAIGAVRQELRHSELLAFLLDPNENHGLGDSFLRRLLQRAVASEPSRASFSPVDLDVCELDDVEVRREWESIDILIVDPRNKIAVIIENKIDAGEHSGQLRRYWSTTERSFQGYRLLGVYLTPDGEDPSDERYIAADYALIADLVKRFLEARSSTMGPDVKTVLRHYEQMLRRHIVSDSEIAELCRKLYRKHRHALELIYMHRPDPRQGAVRELVDELVHARTDFVGDDSPKTYLRFLPDPMGYPQAAAGQRLDQEWPDASLRGRLPGRPGLPEAHLGTGAGPAARGAVQNRSGPTRPLQGQRQDPVPEMAATLSAPDVGCEVVSSGRR